MNFQVFTDYVHSTYIQASLQITERFDFFFSFCLCGGWGGEGGWFVYVYTIMFVWHGWAFCYMQRNYFTKKVFYKKTIWPQWVCDTKVTYFRLDLKTLSRIAICSVQMFYDIQLYAKKNVVHNGKMCLLDSGGKCL